MFVTTYLVQTVINSTIYAFLLLVQYKYHPNTKSTHAAYSILSTFQLDSFESHVQSHPRFIRSSFPALIYPLYWARNVNNYKIPFFHFFQKSLFLQANPYLAHILWTRANHLPTYLYSRNLTISSQLPNLLSLPSKRLPCNLILCPQLFPNPRFFLNFLKTK